MRLIDANDFIEELELSGPDVFAQVEDSAEMGYTKELIVELLKHMPTIDPAPRWIPVTERLPEAFVSVLVQMPGERPFPTVREGFITRDGIWHSALYDREPDEVTHWMPMPKPPEDGGAEND